MARPKVDPAARKQQQSAHYARTDEAFYEQVKAENGGELPADLVGPDGQPRKLTQGPEDAHYRLMWQDCAAKDRKAHEVSKKAGGETQRCAADAPGSGGDGGERYHERFRALDEHSGAPVPGLAYRILREGDLAIRGRTDQQGFTVQLASDDCVEYSLEWMFEEESLQSPNEIHEDGC